MKRKNNIKTIRFYDEIYKSNIYFIVCKSKELAVKKIKDYIGIELPTGNIGEGCTWCIDKYGIVVWLPQFSLTPKWLSVLVHELAHITLETISRRIKIKLEESSEEAYTYHLEWLTKTFLQEWKK